MGEIRIVSTVKTHVYSYLECKKRIIRTCETGGLVEQIFTYRRKSESCPFLENNGDESLNTFQEWAYTRIFTTLDTAQQKYLVNCKAICILLMYSPLEVTWQGGAIVMVQCIMK